MNGKWARGEINRKLFAEVRKKALAEDLNWDKVLTAALTAWVKQREAGGEPPPTVASA